MTIDCAGETHSLLLTEAMDLYIAAARRLIRHVEGLDTTDVRGSGAGRVARGTSGAGCPHPAACPSRLCGTAPLQSSAASINETDSFCLIYSNSHASPFGQAGVAFNEVLVLTLANLASVLINAYIGLFGLCGALVVAFFFVLIALRRRARRPVKQLPHCASMLLRGCAAAPLVRLREWATARVLTNHTSPACCCPRPTVRCVHALELPLHRTQEGVMLRLLHNPRLLDAFLGNAVKVWNSASASVHSSHPPLPTPPPSFPFFFSIFAIAPHASYTCACPICCTCKQATKVRGRRPTVTITSTLAGAPTLTVHSGAGPAEPPPSAVAAPVAPLAPTAGGSHPVASTDAPTLLRSIPSADGMIATTAPVACVGMLPGLGGRQGTDIETGQDQAFECPL